MSPGATNPRPTLYVFGGPNGAGKSTLFKAQNPDYPQVNFDVIQKQNPHLSPMAAGAMAGNQLKELRDKSATFSLEINLHKASNYATLRNFAQFGYRVEVTYVNVDTVEICKARVAERVAKGGHDIPEKQIEERYKSGFELIKQNFDAFDRITLVDNTTSPRKVMTIEQGQVVQQAASLPGWAADIKRHIDQQPGQKVADTAIKPVQPLPKSRRGPKF